MSTVGENNLPGPVAGDAADALTRADAETAAGTGAPLPSFDCRLPGGHHVHMDAPTLAVAWDRLDRAMEKADLTRRGRGILGDLRWKAEGIELPEGNAMAEIEAFLDRICFPHCLLIAEPIAISPHRVNQVLPDECVRCSVASLFGLQREQVPHFYRMGSWPDQLERWASRRKLGVDYRFAGQPDLQLPEWCLGWGPAKHRHQDRAHMVVIHQGEIWHDPSGAGVREFEGWACFESARWTSGKEGG